MSSGGSRIEAVLAMDWMIMPVIPYGATEGGWVRMTDIHKGGGIERGASVNDNDPGGREPPSVG